MIIDLNHETLLSVAEVPRRLPSRPGGRRVHISAVYRWIRRGVRGVRLEAIRVGGTMYTSVEALERFAQRLSTDLSNCVEPHQEDSGGRRGRLEAVTHRLNQMLGEPQNAASQGRGCRHHRDSD